MYQFMVGSTTPRVTRMAMTSGTNKWASRVVVILQLAAWSAVGIVLLQKGVTSLQKGPEGRNVTQIIPTDSPINFQPNPQDNDLSVIPIIEDGLTNHESIDKESWQDIMQNDQSQRSQKLQKNPNYSDLDPEDKPRILESIESSGFKNSVKLTKNDELSKKHFFTKASKKQTKYDELTKEISGNSMNNNAKNSVSMTLDDRKFQRSTTEKTDIMINDANTTDKLLKKINKNVTTSLTKTESIWESRRRLRLSHLSGGGAAAAVAMVAVGAVMLVLGPAVIVLRALDERRQERRFLKLSGRDDLPPTYEQATLMDEAPRYSSLSLNTILGPPPPPSPTPARAQLV